MDQGPLVSEQIEAGAELANEFEKYKPLQAVFWLKASEDGQWFLYLASDQIEDSNVREAYGEVLRILRPKSHVWLDPFQVKVIGTENPLARDVLDIQQKYPASLPTRLRNRMLGGLSIEEAYIYSLPIATSS